MAIRLKKKGKAARKMVQKANGGMNEKLLRKQLQASFDSQEAHADWKKGLAGLDVAQRGLRPPGSPHSPWELLEHARIAQHDILEFSRNAKHKSPDWPSGYWPKTTAPADDAAWDESVRWFFRDMQEMRKLIANPRTDIFAPIPHGTGQTILREAFLLADHNAYHLGELVLVRRLAGAWRES
jgi:hypothetical protein